MKKIKVVKTASDAPTPTCFRCTNWTPGGPVLYGRCAIDKRYYSMFSKVCDHGGPYRKNASATLPGGEANHE